MRYIYAIRDRIANDLVGMHMYTLMLFRTDQQAARYFADAVNDQTSILNKHPGDYDLIKLGYLTEDGYIKTQDVHDIVITGDALVAVQEPKLVQEG